MGVFNGLGKRPKPGWFEDPRRKEEALARLRSQNAKTSSVSNPEFSMDAPELETPAPLVDARSGRFGAGQLEKNPMRVIGSTLLDISAGIRGGQVGYVNDYMDEYNAEQQKADWTAQLDGMNLDPEVRTFAETNPEAFRTMQLQEYQTGKKRDEQLGLLSEMGLPEEVLARAKLDPAAFMAEISKTSGQSKTDTYHDPVNGWQIKPQLYQSGDSAFAFDGTNEPEYFIRPPSFKETEEARAAPIAEQQRNRELGISERNAETARINATRPTPGPNPPGRPRAIIDDPNGPPPIPGDGIQYTPTQDGGRIIEGFNGGRVIKIGVGADGRYAPTDGDPEIPSDKMFPPPSFNLIDGLGDKAGPTINAEQKKMDAIDAERDSAIVIKSIADKYIAMSEGYPFGNKPWDQIGQYFNDQTVGLQGLNARMALEVGKMAKGAMSDADRDWFMLAAPNEKGKPESNAVFAMRSNAIANNANQYAAFMKQYRAEYGVGSLAEAQRYWDMYSLANPIFDDNGDAVGDRMGYQEFFTGSRPKRQDIFERDYPGVRGETGGGLSAAEAEELKRLKEDLGL